MIIVGISAHYHDSACCILRDGVLLAASEEERFSRIKHDAAIPKAAFEYCLQAAGIAITDIDCVAYFEDATLKLERQLWMNLVQHNGARLQLTEAIDPQRWLRDIRSVLGYHGDVRHYEHHLSHGASAFFYSGFDDAAVMTVDGVGEWTTTSYGRGQGHELEIFEEVHFPDSLGLLYSAITSYLGFSVNDAEYKVMGLAPYGTPTYLPHMRRLLHTAPDGGFTLAAEYFDFMSGQRMFTDALVALFEHPPREPESDITAVHQDIAASLQKLLEETLLEKCRYLHSQCPSENLCLAGGVALNCVANGVIATRGPFKNVFVQPAASDAGSALGAAALAHVELTGQRPAMQRLQDVYLGPAYNTDEVQHFLTSSNITSLNFEGRETNLLDHVAQALADQKVIGWFHGRNEFGPRALGARSIIADPRNPTMRDRINALVKKREAFRPFAPTVLEERAAEHFAIDHASPFMLETCQTRSPLNLPAVTHVDGSSRIQTVNAASNGRYYKLIARFNELTGCPIVLNTSFNLRGEPIVLSPYDAFWCFVRSDIDVLVLEDHVIERSAIPAHWMALRAAEAASKSTLAPTQPHHLVYSFF